MSTPLHSRRRGPLGWALLLLAVLLLGSRAGQAQVDTYTFAPGTGTFTPLTGGTPVASIQADDVLSAAIPIPFSFVFDGTAYTSCKASSNGWLTFNPAAAGSSLGNDLATGVASERPRVAPFWDDLNGTGGTASYTTTGTAPNRVFTFEWLNWFRYGNTGGPSFSMQVQLVETSNVVRFVYRREATAITGASASIGLSGAGTGSGSFLSLSDATATASVSSTTETSTIAALPVTGQTYSFTPPVPSLCPTPRSLAVSAITATSASVSFSVTNTTPGPFTILYGPTGFNPAQPSSGSNLYSTITSAGTTATLSGLTPQTGYQFYVTQNCGGANGNSSISGAGSFTTNPNPAANDECANAVSLPVTTSCTTPVVGTVFGATQSLPATTGCGGTVANDVWYSFVASASALQLTTGAQFFSGYYDVRSGTCAASTSVTCGLLGTTTTPSQVVVSGLTSGQTYFLRVYSSSTTPPAASSSGFTLCLTPVTNYCNTGLGGFCGGNNITDVNIAGTTLNATGLTCTTAGSQAYTAYPATGANTTTLQSGVPYQLSVTVDPSSSLSLWIDYNRNLVFEASEHTQVATSTVGTGPTVVTINIPTNAVQGLTGMRLRSRTAGTPNGPTNACTSFGSGETKDFTITIGPPATCPTASNVSVSSITTTTASLAFTASGSATSYALTLTPQNGAPATRTVTASPVALTGLTPNTTYTLSLVSNCTGSTSPAVTLTFTTLPNPATNDECATAVAITVTATCTSATSGSVFGATQSLAPSTTCAGTTANDVWYSFVASGTSQAITFAPQFAGVMDVRSGTCASSSSIYCANAAATATSNNTIGGLTAGLTYFVRVYTSATTQPAAAASSFTLCIVPGPATPANDDCAGAINVPIQFGTCVTQTSADNTAATNSTGAPAPSCAAYQGKDIWFKVTVPVSGSVTVKTLAPAAGSAITDTGMSIYSGTCSTLTEIGCNDDTNGLYSEIALTGRTAGEVLYIRTWAYSGSNTGLIAVCATSPSNCAPPTGPTAGSLTNNTAQLNWVAPTGAPTGVTYELEYGLQGFTPGAGTSVTGLTATTYQLTNLLANSTYCYYVRANCGTTNGSSAFVGPTCFTTPLTAPNNNEPCGAVALTNGSVSASNSGATTSIQNGINTPTCAGGAQPKDVWFRFSPAGTSATFTFTGTAAGAVRVFTSPDCANGPFNQVFCAGATGANVGFTAPVVISGLTSGQRYYMAVSGFGSSDNTGSFTISSANVLAARAQADTEALLVYPNPSATGQLTLRLSNATGAAHATLLNALGQVVLTKALAPAAVEQILSTRNLAAGVYTLRVDRNGEVLTRKVVLE